MDMKARLEQWKREKELKSTKASAQPSSSTTAEQIKEKENQNLVQSKQQATLKVPTQGVKLQTRNTTAQRKEINGRAKKAEESNKIVPKEKIQGAKTIEEKSENQTTLGNVVEISKPAPRDTYKSSGMAKPYEKKRIIEKGVTGRSETRPPSNLNPAPTATSEKPKARKSLLATDIATLKAQSSELLLRSSPSTHNAAKHTYPDTTKISKALAPVSTAEKGSLTPARPSTNLPSPKPIDIPKAPTSIIGGFSFENKTFSYSPAPLHLSSSKTNENNQTYTDLSSFPYTREAPEILTYEASTQTDKADLISFLKSAIAQGLDRNDYLASWVHLAEEHVSQCTTPAELEYPPNCESEAFLESHISSDEEFAESHVDVHEPTYRPTKTPNPVSYTFSDNTPRSASGSVDTESSDADELEKGLLEQPQDYQLREEYLAISTEQDDIPEQKGSSSSRKQKQESRTVFPSYAGHGRISTPAAETEKKGENEVSDATQIGVNAHARMTPTKLSEMSDIVKTLSNMKIKPLKQESDIKEEQNMGSHVTNVILPAKSREAKDLGVKQVITQVRRSSRHVETPDEPIDVDAVYEGNLGLIQNKSLAKAPKTPKTVYKPGYVPSPLSILSKVRQPSISPPSQSPNTAALDIQPSPSNTPSKATPLRLFAQMISEQKPDNSTPLAENPLYIEKENIPTEQINQSDLLGSTRILIKAPEYRGPFTSAAKVLPEEDVDVVRRSPRISKQSSEGKLPAYLQDLSEVISAEDAEDRIRNNPVMDNTNFCTPKAATTERDGWVTEGRRRQQGKETREQSYHPSYART